MTLELLDKVVIEEAQLEQRTFLSRLGMTAWARDPLTLVVPEQTVVIRPDQLEPLMVVLDEFGMQGLKLVWNGSEVGWKLAKGNR